MSAMGHNQTFALQKAMVRFTPDSDRESRHLHRKRHVCFPPKVSAKGQ
jgi:hypothetical protein